MLWNGSSLLRVSLKKNLFLNVYNDVKINRHFGEIFGLPLFGTCFMMIFCLAYSSTLKMEETYSFETSVDSQRTAQRYISEVIPLRNYCFKDHKSHRYFPGHKFYTKNNKNSTFALKVQSQLIPAGITWHSCRPQEESTNNYVFRLLLFHR
jgi:hypothetical protein